MKQVFLLSLFLSINVLTFSQNRNLHFKNGITTEKKENLKPNRIVSENQNFIEVNYNFENANIFDIKQDTSQFQLLKVKGFATMGEVGKPALPSYNDILVVPQKEGLKIKIVEANYQEYDDFYILPALEPQIDSEKDTIPKIKIDKATYSSNSYFPSEIVEIVSVQDYREVPLAFVQIRPIQYNPKSKKVRCYSNIKYQIIFSDSKMKSKPNVKKETLTILKNTVSNPESIEIYSTLTSLPKSGSLTTTTNRNYIIITTDEFIQAAREFADWKTILGFSCEVVSQASWTTSQVKSAINTRYTNWTPKPEYFLIIGDHDDVPGEEHSSSHGTYATDLYYACMGGTGDYTPDMAHGRVSVSSLEQAYLVLRKIINYERNPIVNSTFYQTSVHCAQFQDNNLDGYADRRFTHTSEEVRDYIIGQGKTVNRVYYTSSSAFPKNYNKYHYSDGQAIPSELRKDIAPFYPWTGNNTNIASEINAGKFYVLHRDHGSYTGWKHPNFSVTDISNLTNGDKLPVVFSINCQTGGFLQTECFAEKFIRQSGGGAVGVFAASQISYSGYNDALTVGMFDAIWSNPGLLPNFGSGGISNPNVNTHSDIYKMGHVLNQGLLRMGQTWGLDQYTNRIFHYFGDPSMEMYTASPSTFTGVTVTENGTSATVNTGVSNCKITVCSILDMGSSCYEVADNVSSYTFTDIVKPYYISVTKHNYKPYIYPQDIYIQNYTFTSDRLIIGRNIFVGNNVTPSQTQGPVIIKNGANVIFSAEQDVLLDRGFEVELGGTFEIKKR